MLYVSPKPIITVYTNIILCLWPIRGIPQPSLAHILTQMYINKEVHIFDQCLLYVRTAYENNYLVLHNSHIYLDDVVC